MNKRFLLALAGAAFCGLLSILIARQYLIGEVARRTDQTRNQIVVAAFDIPIGVTLTKNHLKLVNYPKSDLPAGYFANFSDVVGRVAINEVPAQLPVLTRNLAAPGTAPGIWQSVKPGMRAMAVRVDEASSVAGFAQPGNYVDVITVVQRNGKSLSKTILQNIRILANGRQTQLSPDGKASTGGTVTLEVTPGQAELLTLASREGSLQLMIRNIADQQLVRTYGEASQSYIDDELRAKLGNSAPPASSGTAPILPLPAALPSPTPKPKASPEPSASPASRFTPVVIYEGSKAKTVQVLQ